MITPATKYTKGREYLFDMDIPQLMPKRKKMFASETFWTDVSAGVTVGCIAVPLSLAIAVASGVPPEVGLVTAAVSGIAGGLLGGTLLAITGPAAAISLLVVTAVEEHGLAALPLITLGCGALQVASGVTRVGAAAKLVPISVIAGFTTGVGTLIFDGAVAQCTRSLPDPVERAILNARLNAATRLPALVQSAFVFSSVVFMSQIISLIPMPALSGMLIMTGMGMLNPAEFKHCYAVQKSDTVPFLATMGGMLSFGLAEGIRELWQLEEWIGADPVAC